MGWLRIIVFFIVDLMVINFILAPASGGKTGEQWNPSELMDVGKNFDYDVNTYSEKTGTTTASLLYRISEDAENDVRVHGSLATTLGGTLSTSSVTTAELDTKGSTIEIIKPKRGISGLMGGEEDFVLNKYSRMASGTGGPSMAWNIYVYHESLYSFLENKLAANNSWLYLSPTDGYAYQVNVLGKDGDMYIVDIEYPTLEKDRIWINTDYPTPVRKEKYKNTGEVVLSSALIG